MLRHLRPGLHLLSGGGRVVARQARAARVHRPRRCGSSSRQEPTARCASTTRCTAGPGPGAAGMSDALAWLVAARSVGCVRWAMRPSSSSTCCASRPPALRRWPLVLAQIRDRQPLAADHRRPRAWRWVSCWRCRCTHALVTYGAAELRGWWSAGAAARAGPVTALLFRRARGVADGRDRADEAGEQTNRRWS